MRDQTRTKREYNNLHRHNEKTVFKLQRMEVEKLRAEDRAKKAFAYGQVMGFVTGVLFVLAIHYAVAVYFGG